MKYPESGAGLVFDGLKSKYAHNEQYALKAIMRAVGEQSL